MPRKSEYTSHEFPYHISARCRNREFFPIPIDEVWKVMEDYLFFIGHAYKIEILSFVLMSNHFHLLARSPECNLSSAMNYFMGETSRQINTQAKIINQLYGGRFHRTLIDTDRYLLHAYKYIYRNPLAAGMCLRAEDYTYSTLNRALGHGKLNFPFEVDQVLYGNPDQTLKWINTAPTPENTELIRKALQKKVFTIPKVERKTGRRPSLLEGMY